MFSRFAMPVTLMLAVGLTACESSISDTFDVQPQFITYGAIDVNDAWDNVGAFIVRSPTTDAIFPICSGTLISPTVFLTAAHCTEVYRRELAPVGYEAFVSFDNPIPYGGLSSKSTKLIAVAEVVSDPAYNQSQNDPSDLGVLILPANRTHGISPATLPTLGLLDRLADSGALRDAVFTAVGYGVQDRVTGGGVPYYQDLNPIPRMYAYSSFKSLGPGYLRLSQNPATGDGGTCYGDSGGPDFLPVNGVLILAATTVAGDAVCRSTNVDNRLDTPSARAFLGRFVVLP